MLRKLLLLTAYLFCSIGYFASANDEPAHKKGPVKPRAIEEKNTVISPSLPTSRRVSHPLTNDPIKFTLRADKSNVRLGEELTITVTAQFLNIPSVLLFTTAESNAFRLKVLLPDGFVQTGGDYMDYVGTTLSSEKPTVAYTLKGYFSSFSGESRFRILRGPRNADANSLFVEKARLTISVIITKGGRSESTNNVTLSANCDASTLSISGYLSVNNRVSIIIYKDNNYVGSISDIAGPSFNQTFPISGSGSYYARVVEANNDSNNITSSSTAINCSSNPAPLSTGH